MLTKVFILSMIALACVSARHHGHHYRRTRNFLDVNRRRTSSTAEGPQYDFYKFAKEWSGTICYGGTSCNYDNLGKNQWNQHGLWPNQWKTYNIPGCSKEPWDVKKFSAAEKAEVVSFWDGMYSSNEGFWSHEWTKHGTCWDPKKGDLSKMPAALRSHIQSSRTEQANGGPLMVDYFHTVYLTQKPLDFFTVLSRAKITPSQDTYTFDDIKVALQRGFGIKNMDIICKKKDGQSLLSEVRICIDLNYNVMDCPSASRKCDDDVLYPPHETS